MKLLFLELPRNRKMMKFKFKLDSITINKNGSLKLAKIHKFNENSVTILEETLKVHMKNGKKETRYKFSVDVDRALSVGYVDLIWAGIKMTKNYTISV
jgi:hypothetical protein